MKLYPSNTYQIIETGLIHSQESGRELANFDTKGLNVWIRSVHNHYYMCDSLFKREYDLDSIELKSIYEFRFI